MEVKGVILVDLFGKLYTQIKILRGGCRDGIEKRKSGFDEEGVLAQQDTFLNIIQCFNTDVFKYNKMFVCLVVLYPSNISVLIRMGTDLLLGNMNTDFIGLPHWEVTLLVWQ